MVSHSTQQVKNPVYTVGSAISNYFLMLLPEDVGHTHLDVSLETLVNNQL
jgi:hypothetical protein